MVIVKVSPTLLHNDGRLGLWGIHWLKEVGKEFPLVG